MKTAQLEESFNPGVILLHAAGYPLKFGDHFRLAIFTVHLNDNLSKQLMRMRITVGMKKNEQFGFIRNTLQSKHSGCQAMNV